MLKKFITFTIFCLKYKSTHPHERVGSNRSSIGLLELPEYAIKVYAKSHAWTEITSAKKLCNSFWDKFPKMPFGLPLPPPLFCPHRGAISSFCPPAAALHALPPCRASASYWPTRWLLFLSLVSLKGCN